MTLSTRTLTQTLATLAIAASAVSSVLPGATAAYATSVDRGQARLHGHRMVAHTVRCPDCPRYHLDVSVRQYPALHGGKNVTTVKARQQDVTAVEAARLAQQLSAILAPYRLGHIPIHHCNIFCPHG
jgi:hypothetical protein